jgi:hypothetical protein
LLDWSSIESATFFLSGMLKIVRLNMGAFPFVHLEMITASRRGP